MHTLKMVPLLIGNKKNSELKKLKGIFPIVYAFFNKNNTLDTKLIEEQIKLIKKIGSNGIACLGLATEVQKLSYNEKKIIIELIANNCNNKIPTAITIQGNTFDEYAKTGKLPTLTEKEIKELSSTEESNLKEHYEISDDLQSAEEASSSEKDEQEAST